MSVAAQGAWSPAARALIEQPRSLVGRAWTEGDSGRRVIDENPATGEAIVELMLAGERQADAACAAAAAAHEAALWRGLRMSDRRALLSRWVDLLDRHREELAEILVTEIGCPIGLARSTQVAVAIEDLAWFAEAAGRERSEGLPPHSAAAALVGSVIRREPAGVVAAITAYNYPLMIFAWKVGAILAAGCTAVVLPSPLAPLATLAVVRLAEQAGIPPGVLNLVLGDAEAGRALVRHPAVDVVSFTGSEAVGRQIADGAAPSFKRVVLELGGKSPNVLLPGVDVEALAEATFLRVIRNAGQNCGATSRILVQRGDLDRFNAAAEAAATRIRVRDPWDEDCDLGPVISAAHKARVEGFVERAVAAGGRIAAGGGDPGMAAGHYVPATLISGVDNDAEICQEEIFGPVGVSVPYDDLDDAVRIANSTRYALTANICGPTGQAMAVAARLRSGTVSINGGGGLRPEGPWGGPGASGGGRERGEEGVREFLSIKHVHWPL